MNPQVHHLTRVVINLDHMAHNLGLLQELVGNRPLWPAIKANAYGHGIEIVARHLVGLGYTTLCVAHVTEAMQLIEAGIQANYVLFSASLPVHSEAIVAHACEPAVCTLEMVEALARDAHQAGRQVAIHVMIDTGMGRIGIQPEEVPAFLMRCRAFPSVWVKGLMSHFPCADEADKTLSNEEIERFKGVIEATKDYGIELHHMANSAAIFDLPESHFDVVRPGISIYGLPPSGEIINPRVCELKPVLEWKTRITFLKEVSAGVGLSYGHAFHTRQPSLIATIPIGYGDGLSRKLSNNMDVLIHGIRCPQVGRITMDQSLIDITLLRDKVVLGDEVVIIGRQDKETITVEELAEKLSTINYEIVTQISQRVPRIVEHYIQ